MLQLPLILNESFFVHIHLPYVFLLPLWKIDREKISCPPSPSVLRGMKGEKPHKNKRLKNMLLNIHIGVFGPPKRETTIKFIPMQTQIKKRLLKYFKHLHKLILIYKYCHLHTTSRQGIFDLHRSFIGWKGVYSTPNLMIVIELRTEQVIDLQIPQQNKDTKVSKKRKYQQKLWVTNNEVKKMMAKAIS